MISKTRLWSKASKGASLTEYGMLAGLIGLVGLVGVASTGKEVYHVFCVAANTLGEKVYEVRGEEFVPLGGCEDIYAEEDPDNNPTQVPTDGTGEIPFREVTPFDDVLFPAGTVGEQLVLYPYTSLVPDQGPALLGVATNDLVARACYQMQASGPATCSPVSADPQTEVPAGAVNVGYVVVLPDDIGEDFSYDFEVTADVSGGGSGTSGVFEVARVIDITEELASVSFPDVVFPMYSTGLNEDFYQASLFSEIAQEVIFEIESKGGTDHSSCVMANGGSYNCNSVSSHSNDDERVLDPGNGETAGIIANLLSDPRLPYSHTVDIRLTSVSDPNVSRLYTGVNVSRVASPVLMDLSGMSFPDFNVEAGYTGFEYFMTELAGDFGGDLRLSVDEESGSNVTSLGQCAQNNEFSTISCNSNSYYTVSDVTKDVGFRFALPTHENTLYQDYTQELEFRIASDIDPSVVHKFNNITVTRPALPSVVSATTTFPDTVISSTSNSTTIYKQMQGEFTSDMYWSVESVGDSVPGTHTYGACYNNRCASSRSSGASVYSTTSSGSLGYEVKFPTAEPGNFEQYVDLEMILKSVYDETKFQTFTTRVTREALPIVFEPSFSFSDMTVPSNQTGRISGVMSKTGSINSDLRVSVRMTDRSNNWAPNIKACGGRSTAVTQCGSSTTTLNKWVYDTALDTDGYIGWMLGLYGSDAPQSGEGDYWIDIEIKVQSGLYADDSSQYEEEIWGFRVTRPGI